VIVNQLLCSAVIFAHIMIRPVIKRCTGVIFVTTQSLSRTVHSTRSAVKNSRIPVSTVALECKEARSHCEETRELPGERDKARNNVRCTQARKTTHGLDGQHQDVDRTPRGRVSQNDRGQRQMEKVRPCRGQPSDRGRLKDRTEIALSIIVLPQPAGTKCGSDAVAPDQRTRRVMSKFHYRRWPGQASSLVSSGRVADKVAAKSGRATV